MSDYRMTNVWRWTPPNPKSDLPAETSVKAGIQNPKCGSQSAFLSETRSIKFTVLI